MLIYEESKNDNSSIQVDYRLVEHWWIYHEWQYWVIGTMRTEVEDSVYSHNTQIWSQVKEGFLKDKDLYNI
jgi:hypothetical protein